MNKGQQSYRFYRLGIPFRGMALCLLLLLSLNSKVQAQLSIAGAFESATTPFWDPISPEGLRFLENGYSFGINYLWSIGENQLFRIGPGFRHRHFNISVLDAGPAEIELTGIQLKTQLYLGELLLNCECPGLKQRIFLLGDVGWHYARMQVETIDPVEFVQDKSLGIAAGVGFHFPVGDYIILSPIFRFTQFPEINWEGLEQFSAVDGNPYFRTASEIRIFQIELQVSFNSTKN